MPIDPPRSVAIVANAPGHTHPVKEIDEADWVVRFNNAPGFGSWSGTRCTHLALVNHGGQMREWLEEPDFIRRPVLETAEAILFAFPPKNEPVEAQNEDGRDWTREAAAMLAPLRIPMETISADTIGEARRILASPERPNPNPSTGFLVALHLLAKLPPTARVNAYGFGFAGWDGHSWDGERAWFERMHRENRLRLHPGEAGV